MFILDLDPKLAAEYLTIQHVSYYIKVLRDSFTGAHVPYHYILISPKELKCVDRNIYYSSANYIWFSEFYKALVKLSDPDTNFVKNFNEDFLFNIDKIKFKGKGLQFIPELNSAGETLIDIKNNEDVVLNNRLLYVRKKYKLKSFRKKYPSWYESINVDIINDYSAKSRSYLKIQQDGDKYRYFVATYFNKWKELENIPPEMDYFIDYLTTKKV